jgi:hypothetical protein
LRTSISHRIFRKRKTGTADADAIHSKKEIKTEDHSEAPTQTKKQKKMKAIKEEGPETDNDKKKDQENDANKSDKQTSSSKEANKTGKEEGRAKAAGGKKQLAKRMI